MHKPVGATADYINKKSKLPLMVRIARAGQVLQQRPGLILLHAVHWRGKKACGVSHGGPDRFSFQRKVPMHEQFNKQAGRTGARVMLVAAIASGQGKTTVTAALARRLQQMGQTVRVFKCGPDFLDPLILARASGGTVHTLDLWIVGLEQCRQRLAEATRAADVVLIEGVMGLYDGNPSAAALARLLDLPVLLVIDASSMAQTAGAVVLGLRDYGPVNVVGVVANRVASDSHAKMIAGSLRDIPLLATLPKQSVQLPGRHLGLLMPDEVEGIDAMLDALAAQLQLDEAAWRALAPRAFDAPLPEKIAPLLAGTIIAVARDAAFCFLNPANVEVLEMLGAQLRYFSPLENQPVPAEAHCIYLPGGYPELHGATLALADRWQDSIRAAHAAGLPILAECGGMMAVSEAIVDKEGHSWPMPALLAGTARMQPRLAGLGSQAMPTASGELRGHTFHYSTLETNVVPATRTSKHPSAAPGEAVYQVGSLTASYFHGFFPSNPSAVASLFTPAAAGSLSVTPTRSLSRP